MNTYSPVMQEDGTYVITARPENQESFTQKTVAANLILRPIKNVLNIALYGSYNRYESRGLSYSHNFNAWRWRASAYLMHGQLERVGRHIQCSEKASSARA